MAKSKIKKLKLRIPVAKPSIRHKTKKDYNRKKLKLELKKYVDK